MIKFFWPQTNILGHKIPNIFEISFQVIVFVPPKEPIKGVLLHVLFLFMKFETSFTVSLNFINYNKKSDGNSPLFPTASSLNPIPNQLGHMTYNERADSALTW